jgi:protein O-mannosyl-transferase
MTVIMITLEVLVVLFVCMRHLWSRKKLMLLLKEKEFLDPEKWSCKEIAHTFLLVLAVLVAYITSFNGVYQFDDFRMIVNNPVVHHFTAWYKDLLHGGIRPLLKLTYLIHIPGGDLFWFHFFNMAVHIANTILVYLLTRFVAKNTLDTDRTQLLPLVTALLFGLHPVQTESVTYITGRSVSLMSFFYFCSILCFLWGRIYGKRILFYGVGPFMFILSLLTRETALTLPLTLLLLEHIMPHERSFINRMKFHKVYWAVASVFALSGLLHPGYRRFLLNALWLRPLKESLLTHVHGVFYIFTHGVIPWHLNADPDIRLIHSISFSLALEITMILGAFFVGLLLMNRHRYLSFSILWVLLSVFLPNLVFGRADVINERHFYPAMWGVCLLLSWLLTWPFPLKRSKSLSLKLTTLCLVISLGILTFLRNEVYKSEVLFWQDVASKSGQKARVHNNLGYAYYLSADYNKARQAYMKALELDPGLSIARHNMILLEEDKINSSISPP